jgi:hypothetical protein
MAVLGSACSSRQVWNRSPQKIHQKNSVLSNKYVKRAGLLFTLRFWIAQQETFLLCIMKIPGTKKHIIYGIRHVCVHAFRKFCRPGYAREMKRELRRQSGGGRCTHLAHILSEKRHTLQNEPFYFSSVLLTLGVEKRPKHRLPRKPATLYWYSECNATRVFMTAEL